MASGETIGGVVKLFREQNDGSLLPLTGEIPVDRFDSYNNDRDPENRLYFNVSISDHREKPDGAGERIIPDAQYFNSEDIVVKFYADASPADVDVDSPAISIGVVERDTVRGKILTRTLKGKDSNLENNVTPDTSGWVEYFRYEVPENREIRISGEFAPVPVEV